MSKTIHALVALSLLSASPAFAEDVVDEAGASGNSASDQAVAKDASIDRGFLTSHAENIGKDKWAFNAYEILFVGLTYGFTDDIQLSLSTLLPVTTDIPLVLALQPKFVVYRSDSTVVSLRTPITFIHESGDADVGFIGVGALIDQYLDSQGRFAIHGGLMVAGVLGSVEGADIGLSDGVAFQLDLGVSLGVAKILKIMVEAQVFGAASHGEFEVADAVLINYGVRFHGEGLAADLGFIRPIGVDTDTLLLGVPYIAFSARF